MKKYELYVGCNDKDTLKQEIATEDALKKALEIVGDCTYTLKNGAYTMENGKRVYENTLHFELLFREEEEIKNICSQLKKALNQESIAVTSQELNSELY